MAYLKPPMFVQRIFNPLAMRFGIGGAAKLAIAGRRSGKRRTVPVIPFDHDGARFLVSTRGESEWVRNLRAAGGAGELRMRGASERFRAVEIPASERPPIIAGYRRTAGKTLDTYFDSLPDPADHPVFRIEGRGA